MKRIVSRAVTLAYPDFNKPFVLYTDASDFQLGAVITQDGKPLAFYSRKLNSAQRNYTVTEKELLSIVETLREFRGILLGHEIKIYTDHKNLEQINSTASSQRAMRWRILIEEFGPEIVYIKGTENTIADSLSRLEKRGETPAYKETHQQMCFAMRLFTSIKRSEESFFEDEIEEDDTPFPLDLVVVAQE